MTEILDRPSLSERMLKSSLQSLGVRPAFTLGFTTTALGAFLPTPAEWDSGKPQIIGSNITRLLDSGEASMRIYGTRDDNLARQKETAGRFTGWTRARHFALADPIEGATVKEVADIPIRGGERVLPILRLMEHGNGSDEEFVMSLPDLARYFQRERVEIVLT